MPDLWPDDFGTSTIMPPISILREQAQIIGAKTKGLIEGAVSTVKSESEFSHVFSLVVPSLDNYTYILLIVIHPIQLYPARIVVKVGSTTQTLNAANEGDFLAQLKNALSLPEVKQLIAALLSQAQAAA